MKENLKPNPYEYIFYLQTYLLVKKYFCFFLLFFLIGCFNDPEQEILKSAEYEWKQNRFGNSIAKYKAIVEEFPDGKYVDQSLLRLGEIYRLNLDQEKEALVYLYRLVNKGNGDYKRIAQETIASIYEDDLRNYNQAIIEYQRLIHMYPEPQYAQENQYKIALCYFKKGDYFQALTEFEILLKDYPGSKLKEEVFFHKSNCFYIMGECDKAVEGYNEFLSNYPNSKYFFEAKYSIANCLEEKEKLAEALVVYKSLKVEYGDNKLLKIKIDGLGERLRKRRR